MKSLIFSYETPMNGYTYIYIFQVTIIRQSQDYIFENVSI